MREIKLQVTQRDHRQSPGSFKVNKIVEGVANMQDHLPGRGEVYYRGLIWVVDQKGDGVWKLSGFETFLKEI